METRAHHVIIGAFTIGVFLLALGFTLWLSKASIEREFGYYDVVFTEAVTGLGKGSPVQYNGIKVGEVVQLKLDPQDPRKVIARVRVDYGTPIRQDTKARLGLLGVTGLAFIQLSGGSPASPALLPTPQRPVPEIRAEESALSKLLASGSDIVTSVNDLMFRLDDLLSQENIDHVAATLKHLDQVSGTVAGEREELGTALRQLADASGQLKTTLVTLNEMAVNTNKLVGTDVHRVLQTTEQALASVDRVANSADSLLKDNRAALDNFGNQGLGQIGPTLIDLREALHSFKQVTDRLGASNSLLLGGDQPREFEPR